MTYELWAGDVCLGRSTLEFQHLSNITFGGEFTPDPDHTDAVERMAVNIDCVSSWMNRETRNAAGDYIVTPHYRNSRLFTTIAELVARQFDPSLQLRKADGTVIPSRHLVLRDLERLTLFPELIEEAIAAGEENVACDPEEPPPPFNISPEARELYREMQAELEEEARANACGSDAGANVIDEADEAWAAELEAMARTLRARFQLHVMIEREGDIPADVSWLG